VTESRCFKLLLTSALWSAFTIAVTAQGGRNNAAPARTPQLVRTGNVMACRPRGSKQG